MLRSRAQGLRRAADALGYPSRVPRGPHGCVWLIRRFVDAEATSRSSRTPWRRRRGRSCSTSPELDSPTAGTIARSRLIKDYHLEDAALAEISEIVHDADLMDEKYGRPESDGAGRHYPRHAARLPDDHTLTGYTDAVFDGLYAYLSREVL